MVNLSSTDSAADFFSPALAMYSLQTAVVLLTAAVLGPAVLPAAGATHQGANRAGPVAGQQRCMAQLINVGFICSIHNVPK